MDPKELYELSREDLIDRAASVGVSRPETLTQVELIDEIVTKTTPIWRRPLVRGLLGRARDLVARVIERGLHLPEAAKLFRGPPPEDSLPKPPPPLPTVTLAEIYAAQGHTAKALSVLDEVLRTEPEHREARKLRTRLLAAPGGEASSAAAGHGSRSSPTAAHAPAPPHGNPGSRHHPGSVRNPGPKHDNPGAKDNPGSMDNPGRKHDNPGAKDKLGPLDDRGPKQQEPGTSDERTTLDNPGSKRDNHEATDGVDASAARAEPTAGAEREAGGESQPAPTPPEQAGAAPPDEGAPEPSSSPAPGEPANGYDRDDVVALATDPYTAYVYWELRPKRFARVRWSDPSGKLVLRLFAVEPVLADTRTRTWDVEVDALVGDLFVRGLVPGSELRLCLAWQGEKGFVPLAIAPSTQMPRDYQYTAPSTARAVWHPPAGPAPIPCA
jgi:hypothetical protein